MSRDTTNNCVIGEAPHVDEDGPRRQGGPVDRRQRRPRARGHRRGHRRHPRPPERRQVGRRQPHDPTKPADHPQPDHRRVQQPARQIVFVDTPGVHGAKKERTASWSARRSLGIIRHLRRRRRQHRPAGRRRGADPARPRRSPPPGPGHQQGRHGEAPHPGLGAGAVLRHPRHQRRTADRRSRWCFCPKGRRSSTPST